MSTGKKGDLFRARKFSESLRGLLESLPSDAEKQQIASNLDVIISFLNQIKESLESIPSRETTTAVASAIDSLDALFARARQLPPVAAALGIRPPDHRVKPQPLTEADSEGAKKLLDQLEKLPIDELRAKLDASSEISLRELQAIAALMGIRSTQRTSREALAHQIATKIGNVRGYEALRRGTEGTE